MIGGRWFFVLGGVILMFTGVLQALVRPRKPREHRFWNRATVWAAFCLLLGLAFAMLGAGVLPLRR